MAKRKSAISKYLAEIGSKGGKTTGPTKARDPKKMSAAAKKRWEKKGNSETGNKEP